MLSKILIPSALFVSTLGGLLLFGDKQQTTFGAPTASIRVERSINPEADSLYWLGTSTKAWKDIYTDQLCLTGDVCRTTWPSGSGGAFPFTPTTNYNASANSTSTPMWFTAGLMGSTTANYFNGATIGALKTPLISSETSAGVILEAANGTDVGIFGAGNTANVTLYGGLNINGATRLATSLDGPLHANAGTVGATSTIGVVYGGTGASTLTGLVVGNGTSAFTAYAGGSCTNQFLRALSASGGFTCASVALGSDVSGTLGITNGGTGTTTLQSGRVLYGGATSYQSVATGTISAGTGISISATVYGLLNAASVSINQAANLVWTGNLDFGGATGLEMPNGTAPVADAIGEFALDTTSNLVIVATSTSATAVGTIPLFQYPAFTISTTTSFSATNTVPLGTAFVAENWLSIQCFTDVGTAVVRFGNGSASTTAFQASTTIGTVTLNYAYTAANRRFIDIGTPASSPTRVSCTVRKQITRD